MEIIKRLVKFGTYSEGVIIDKKVREMLGTKRGDYVRIIVERMTKK